MKTSTHRDIIDIYAKWENHALEISMLMFQFAREQARKESGARIDQMKKDLGTFIGTSPDMR